jgi:hypothetical protein
MFRFLLLYAAVFILFCNTGFTQVAVSKSYIKFTKIAGLEVGSKGVKMTVLERNTDNANEIKLLKDSAVNTDFINFSTESFDATLNALSGLYKFILVNYKISASDIAVVISSGVKAQADKMKKQVFIRTFIDAFRIRINEENKPVEVVDVLKESMLSHYGIVPEVYRHNTFLIDIGSGNTKGGYFKPGINEFVMFQIPSGTKSTANLSEKKCGAGCDFNNYKVNTFSVADSLEKSEIIYAVNASGAYPVNSTMAISGGIAWAVATLLHPEQMETTSLDVTYKEILQFRENLIRFEKIIPDTSQLQIKGIPVYKLSAIRKEVKRVLNVFDTRSLLAGSTLMLKIMRQFEAVNTSKKFKLIKNGQVGWITGYILNQGGLGKK